MEKKRKEREGQREEVGTNSLYKEKLTKNMSSFTSVCSTVGTLDSVTPLKHFYALTSWKISTSNICGTTGPLWGDDKGGIGPFVPGPGLRWTRNHNNVLYQPQNNCMFQYLLG